MGFTKRKPVRRAVKKAVKGVKKATLKRKTGLDAKGNRKKGYKLKKPTKKTARRIGAVAAVAVVAILVTAALRAYGVPATPANIAAMGARAKTYVTAKMAAGGRVTRAGFLVFMTAMGGRGGPAPPDGLGPSDGGRLGLDPRGADADADLFQEAHQSMPELRHEELKDEMRAIGRLQKEKTQSKKWTQVGAETPRPVKYSKKWTEADQFAFERAEAAARKRRLAAEGRRDLSMGPRLSRAQVDALT